jgi:hypothetical protein
MFRRVLKAGWLVVILAAMLVWAAPASASARPPRGKYSCYYNGYTSSFYLGDLHIDSASKYHYTGAGHGRGTYTSSGKRLTFHSGPLKHEYAIVSPPHSNGSPHTFWDLVLYVHHQYASDCEGPFRK